MQEESNSYRRSILKRPLSIFLLTALYQVVVFTLRYDRQPKQEIQTTGHSRSAGVTSPATCTTLMCRGDPRSTVHHSCIETTEAVHAIVAREPSTACDA